MGNINNNGARNIFREAILPFHKNNREEINFKGIIFYFKKYLKFNIF